MTSLSVSLSADPVEEIKAGFEILKSLGLRHRGVNVISCPSCARQQFDVIKNNALKLGAIGSGISGSGPTIFALCDSKNIAEDVLQFSKSYYKSLDIKCDIFLSEINFKGPTII